MREKRIAIANLASVIWLDNPRVMVLEQFTSEYECDALIAAEQNQMQYSRGTHSEH